MAKALFSKVKFLSILETLFTCKVPNFVSTTCIALYNLLYKAINIFINIFLAKLMTENLMVPIGCTNCPNKQFSEALEQKH